MTYYAEHFLKPEDGYRARVVFQLPIGYRVPPAKFEVDGSLSAVVQEFGDRRVVTVGPFMTREEATKYCRRLATAIAYAGLRSSQSVRVTPDFQEVRMVDEPHDLSPVGVTGPIGVGFGQFDVAAVIPPGLHVLFGHVPESRAIGSSSVERFATRIRDGLALPSATSMWDYPKLRLALALFADSYFEQHLEAQFLSHVTVLEALKTQGPMSAKACSMIDKWKGQLNDLPESERNSLSSSFNRLRQETIGRAIKNLVRLAVDDGAAKEAYEMYGIRSTFLHNGNGRDDVRTKLGRLTELVRQVHPPRADNRGSGPGGSSTGP